MSTGNPPDLSNVPWNIKQKIIDFSGVQMSPTIRLLTKDFKELVDTSPMTYYKLYLNLTMDQKSDKMEFEMARGPTEYIYATQNFLRFSPHPDGYVVENKHFKKIVKMEKNGDEVPHITGAVRHLEKILQNRRLRFENLQIGFTSASSRVHKTRFVKLFEKRKDQLLAGLEAILSRQNRKVLVKNLDIGFRAPQDDYVRILNCLQPGYLEKIEFSGPRTNKQLDMELDRVAQMDQWRQAKCLSVRWYFINLPFDNWSYFSEARVTMRNDTISPEVLLNMLGFYANSPTFQKVDISLDSLNCAAVGETLAHLPTCYPCRRNKLAVPLPNTLYYFYIEWNEFGIQVSKRSIFSPPPIFHYLDL